MCLPGGICSTHSWSTLGSSRTCSSIHESGVLPHIPCVLSLGLILHQDRAVGLCGTGGNAGEFVVQPFKRDFVDGDLHFTPMLIQIEQEGGGKKEKPELPGQTGKGWRSNKLEVPKWEFPAHIFPILQNWAGWCWSASSPALGLGRVPAGV